jgi:septal ring factor EnvC (AmiA/AmiB activator)
MNESNIIDILLGVVLALFGFIMKYITGRVQDNESKIDDLRVDLAKQGQENQELYSNIKRIDRNLSEIYKKLDEIIIAVRTK